MFESVELVGILLVSVRITLILVSLTWLVRQCKIPLIFINTKNDNGAAVAAQFMWLIALFLLTSTLSTVAYIFSPPQSLPRFWFVCIGYVAFVLSGYTPRLYFSYQLRTLLNRLVPDWMLTLVRYTPALLIPLDIILIMGDTINITFGGWQNIVDNVPMNKTSVDSFGLNLTLLSIAIIVLPMISFDTFQLFLFRKGTTVLRSDIARRRAMHVVLLAFLLSLSASGVAAIGAILGGVWISSCSIAVDITSLIIPCMPLVVKRYQKLDKYVTDLENMGEKVFRRSKTPTGVPIIGASQTAASFAKMEVSMNVKAIDNVPNKAGISAYDENKTLA